MRRQWRRKGFEKVLKEVLRRFQEGFKGGLEEVSKEVLRRFGGGFEGGVEGCFEGGLEATMTRLLARDPNGYFVYSYHL